MPNPQKANLLRGKDLIAIGIFSSQLFCSEFHLYADQRSASFKAAFCPLPRGSRIVIVVSHDDEFMHLDR